MSNLKFQIMKREKLLKSLALGMFILSSIAIVSCKDDDNGGGNGGKIDPSTIATSNLIAYFPFDNNGNDAVGTLTPTSNGVTYVAGVRNNAYQGADGAYFLYDLPTGSKLKTLKTFTISMWFYGTPAIDGVAPVPGILQINGTSDATWGNMCLTQDRMPAAADSLNIKMVFHKDGADWANQFVGFSNSAFTENYWMHIVFTYDNATSKYLVYVNGTALELNSGITDRWAEDDTHTPRTALGDLAFVDATKMSIGGWMQRVIGASTDEWMGYFTGKMDELRIYDRSLTSTEVQNLFVAEVSQMTAE